MMAPALPSTPRGVVAHLVRAATGADNAIRPAAVREILGAVFRLREVQNRLLQALRFAHWAVLHEPNVLFLCGRVK